MMTIIAMIAATINFNCGGREENVSYIIVCVHGKDIACTYTYIEFL